MNAIQRFESQAALFASQPSRLSLLGQPKIGTDAPLVTVNVWRNHGFESLVPLAAPYFSFGGGRAEFRISDYDDTLTFTEHRPADAELLWLDSSRITLPFADWCTWLEGRIRVLRAATSAPILLATWCADPKDGAVLQTLADSIPAVYFADLAAACSDAKVPLLDKRSSGLTGSPLSNAAQVILARKLACHWLPGALRSPIKAVALDLDNTLHAGVLGEDGIDGVQLTPGHAALQRYIKSLQKRGIFIALVSRNERPDVEALFAQRPDYPLRWDDFSAIEVSWGDKAAAITRITQTLRIAPDAVLFVDDNPGELASVTRQHPQTHTVYAPPEANQTLQAIHFYPGLWRWKVESDDTKRIADLQAGAEREALAKSITDPAEYFRSLQVTLLYRHDPVEQLTRLADLCHKTNQFNLALRRLNQSDLAQRLGGSNACVTSVQLTDRLSDSGVIAVIVAERRGAQLVVEELCVSCRAMGRNLEDSIILPALRGMPIFVGCQEVIFRVEHGPRNQPALNWLAQLLELKSPPDPGHHLIPAQRLINFIPAAGVTLTQA